LRMFTQPVYYNNAGNADNTAQYVSKRHHLICDYNSRFLTFFSLFPNLDLSTIYFFIINK
jgi:hypothetical protein